MLQLRCRTKKPLIEADVVHARDVADEGGGVANNAGDADEPDVAVEYDAAGVVDEADVADGTKKESQ